MKSLLASIIMSCFLSAGLFGQTMTIKPYLQDATPHSIFILWETSEGEESIVEWGPTDTLGQSVAGSFSVHEGRVLHQVKIDSLQGFTKYYYKVRTGSIESEVYSFKTPPHAHDHEPFHLVAMSDMQRDNAFPDKFQEVVEEGILQYLNDHYGEDVSEHLALIMIPGDFVQNGNNFDSWRETFFNPGEELFNQVPVYPVLGNHENNSSYYFQYFKLPENGTPGFEERWWYKDYGNVRIVGMDSNNPFANQEQLDWLENLLDATCALDSIDFVFAQLHHPHKSELWTPGESDFTGEVVHHLEHFSTDCGKPSIHFFGHTHGYSRGQSRDHKHLWINVATAGGAIDNWGEFPNFDYDEFSVSQDEYGFVSVEIEDDPDPKIVIRRISRGDQDQVVDNHLTDSLVIRLLPSTVTTPIVLSPNEEGLAPECVTLKAGPYASEAVPEIAHGQSHWQVATDAADFSDPVFESWKNFENWYGDIDTQAEDDLTDEKVTGLEEHTAYWWRVRYRDREMNWSAWSAPVSFTTGESIRSPNVLLNPGAEDSLMQWIVLEGVVEALVANVCDGVAPHSGERYFVVGGLCTESEVARGIQNIPVDMYADSIDTGNFMVDFGGYLSNYSGSDLPEMRLIFLDQDSMALGSSSVLSTLNNSWTLVREKLNMPVQTRTIQVELKGTRNAGVDNDAYFDDLFVRIGTEQSDCDDLSAVPNSVVPIIPVYDVVPNPVEAISWISIGTLYDPNIQMLVVDANGSKVDCKTKYASEKIFFETDHLPFGTYFFWIRSRGKIIGKGKFVVL